MTKSGRKSDGSPKADAQTPLDQVSQTFSDMADTFREATLADWMQDDIEQWQHLTSRARGIVEDYLENASDQSDESNFQIPDPAVVSKAFVRLGFSAFNNPVAVANAHIKYAFDVGRVLSNAGQRALGLEAETIATVPSGDKRFKDAQWQDDVVFDTLKQLYLVTSENVVDTVRDMTGLDDQTKNMVEFYTQRFMDSLSPTNFPVTNPVVMRATAEENGANILRGLDNLLDDLERGRGRLKIRMVDEDAFELGKNIATTPGKVVYRNDLIELIQYTPTTETVAERPLLIIPPWINKFYILDLKAKNSFIKWAVDQGQTVFVISWINPDRSLADKHFENYMLDGPIAAIDVVKAITKQDQVNAIGYCIGGTLTSATLAYLKAKGRNDVASCTFFTTLIDFERAGDLKVFIDDEQLDLMEDHMNKTGFLESKHMASVFNLMRSNDLIWSFVINNYYLGKDPMAFDLLYWNADATRMPAMQQAFYLRNMYLHNRLKTPNGITLDGVPIDLSTIETPAFFLSTKDDHIAPWVATYDGTRLFSGPVKFVLAGSGHIAGVINPPAANKYPHWVNDDLPVSADDWLDAAQQIDGSWWPTWLKWLEPNMGQQIPARKEGSKKYPPLEDAPGSYVRVVARDD